MKKRLMVVEDDARLLAAITACLRQSGYEIMTARNGEEALVRIAETIPDLIVSDVLMPRADGYSLVAKLRSNPRTDLIPVVFLTAKDNRGDRLNGIRAGVDAYLVKPFEPEELIIVIENILERVSRTHTRVALAANASNNLAASVLNENWKIDKSTDLTEAEERIACLVADGLSNKEIAARLEISARTVESHISHILAKKGWSNRVEIARHIVRQNS